jgi:outer membrane protein assembly factor BamB
MTMLTGLTAIERALASGEVFIPMRNGRLWKLRRNGATKRWSTRPDHFRIPVKAGLHVCDEITHESTLESLPIVNADDNTPGTVYVLR